MGHCRNGDGRRSYGLFLGKNNDLHASPARRQRLQHLRPVHRPQVLDDVRLAQAVERGVQVLAVGVDEAVDLGQHVVGTAGDGRVVAVRIVATCVVRRRVLVPTAVRGQRLARVGDLCQQLQRQQELSERQLRRLWVVHTGLEPARVLVYRLRHSVVEVVEREVELVVGPGLGFGLREVLAVDELEHPPVHQPVARDVVQQHVRRVLLAREGADALLDGKLEAVLYRRVRLELLHQLVGARHVEELGVQQPPALGQEERELQVRRVVVQYPEQVVDELDAHIDRLDERQVLDLPELVFHIKEAFPQGARVRLDDDLVGLFLVLERFLVNELDNVGGERGRSGSAAEEGPVVGRRDRRRARGRAGSRCGHSGGNGSYVGWEERARREYFWWVRWEVFLGDRRFP